MKKILFLSEKIVPVIKLYEKILKKGKMVVFATSLNEDCLYYQDDYDAIVIFGDSFNVDMHELYVENIVSTSTREVEHFLINVLKY